MITVTNLAGDVTVPIFNIADDFQLIESVDGQSEISFTCFPGSNSPGYDILASESLLEIEGLEFKVKQYSNTLFSKSVTAVNIFYENSKKRINTIYSGDNTLTSHLNFILNGTGWTFDISQNIRNLTAELNNFGNDNIISLLNVLKTVYNIEYKILPNKSLIFRRTIGDNTDFQYRYKHNINSVVLNESTTNLYTTVMAYGAEGIQARYTSFTSVAFGLLEAEPIREERFTDVQSLLEYAQNSIQDVPELTIETTIPKITSRGLGDSIWLIYEPLNIEMKTRILRQTKILQNNKLITSSVIFGNNLGKSAVDLFVNQQEVIERAKVIPPATKKELQDAVETINIAVSGKLSIGQTINDINSLNVSDANRINFSKLNLQGFNISNGDITGDVNINVNTNIGLGNEITFANAATITSNPAVFKLESRVDMSYIARRHFFFGTVDFSGADVVGLGL